MARLAAMTLLLVMSAVAQPDPAAMEKLMADEKANSETMATAISTYRDTALSKIQEETAADTAKVAHLEAFRVHSQAVANQAAADKMTESASQAKDAMDKAKAAVDAADAAEAVAIAEESEKANAAAIAQTGSDNAKASYERAIATRKSEEEALRELEGLYEFGAATASRLKLELAAAAQKEKSATSVEASSKKALESAAAQASECRTKYGTEEAAEADQGPPNDEAQMAAGKASSVARNAQAARDRAKSDIDGKRAEAHAAERRATADEANAKHLADAASKLSTEAAGTADSFAN